MKVLKKRYWIVYCSWNGPLLQRSLSPFLCKKLFACINLDFHFFLFYQWHLLWLSKNVRFKHNCLNCFILGRNQTPPMFLLFTVTECSKSKENKQLNVPMDNKNKNYRRREAQQRGGSGIHYFVAFTVPEAARHYYDSDYLSHDVKNNCSSPGGDRTISCSRSLSLALHCVRVDNFLSERHYNL